MPETPKILLLDDERDTLELYQQYLLTLPSAPMVKTCASGAKALAMLESESFNLMISDLNMPKMDGLQVLAIVRRKFPAMKIMVMTAVVDEQFRARAYSLGVDLFWQKPSTEQEIKLFLDGVQSVLQRSESGGFRGVQSKSLVDIVQLECLSHASTVLKITNGNLVGRIWIFNGELMDAALGDLTGEEAFKKIMTWRTGNFENLPADPGRERRIFNTVDGLLLDVVQLMDEDQARAATAGQTAGELPPESEPRETPLQQSAKVKGVDFLLAVPQEAGQTAEAWGVENAGPMQQWVAETWSEFTQLGQAFVAGNLKEIQGRSLRRHLSLVPTGKQLLCVGFDRTATPAECRETLNAVLSKWAS